MSKSPIKETVIKGGSIVQAVGGVIGNGGGDPALPATSSLVWDLDARNLDGSENSSLADSAAIATAANHGTGSDFNQTNATYRPTLSKGTGPNSTDVLVNANNLGLKATGSASETSFIQNAVEFDMMLVMYKDTASAPWPTGNSSGTNAKGYGQYWYGDDRGYMSIFNGAGTVAAHTTASPVVFPEATWVVQFWRGTGSSGVLQCSHDLGDTFTTGTGVGTLSTGDGTRDHGIGGLNLGGDHNNNAMTGKIARVLLWSTNLSGSELGELQDHVSTVYGL